MTKTPVTIFSGYLGSGKTTIIMNSLKQYKAPKNFAMIKNEFGDASVDGALAKMNNLAVYELVNGCLCCILVGSLNDAIDELIEKAHPERILIEASGDALPFPIVLELKKNPKVFLDGVISVVDCINFEKVKDTSVVAREQAKYTDLIIFNKTDLADEAQLYRVHEEIFGINPDTAKIDANDGAVDPRILFGIDHQDIDEVYSPSDHHHELESFTFTSSKPLNQEMVDQVLKACKADAFYRIKGVVHCNDGQVRLVNGVFNSISWQEIDPDETSTRIVFIGKNIARHQEVIFDYLNQAS